MEFIVTEDFWSHLDEIVCVLRSAYNVTVDMQRIGYSLSDFYISWIRITKNLSRIVNNEPVFNLASKLMEKMERRAPSLFKSPLMLCSIYLDPRIMFKLSDEQKVKAAMDLVTIFERNADDRKGEQCADDTLDEIQEDYHAQNIGSYQSSSDLLFQEMSIYELEKPFAIKSTVMKFWNEHSEKYKLLSPLANLLHAVPSNQSCTERSFSSFSYIRSKHRMSMSAENLANVLMIRLNKDIFYSERQKQIEKILKM